MTLSSPIAHLARYATRVAIYPAPNIGLTHLFPERSHNIAGTHKDTAFSIPFDIALKAPAILRRAFPDARITMEPELQNEIERILRTERSSFDLSTAEDAFLPSKVLAYEPKPFQRAAAAYGMTQKSWLNSLDMGLGKTLVALWIAEYEKLPTLWITPASLVLNLEREIRKMTGKRSCIFSGRVPAEKDLGYILSGAFDHFIINYEVFGSEDRVKVRDANGITRGETIRRLWPETFNLAAKFGKIKMVVADEVHKCKSMDALRTKALMDLEIARKIPMTGTAITNRLDELWTILHWIDRKRFPTKDGFLQTYARYDGSVRDPAKLQKDLAPYIFRRRKRDVLKDLPELIRITHSIEMPDRHKERYELALDGVYQTQTGAESEITNPLAELNRLREIISDAKSEATVEYVKNLLEEDPEAKVIIFSNFTNPVLNIARELNCRAVYGDTKFTTRMQYCDDFNNRSDIRTISIAMQVGQEGLNITAATHVVFNDLYWHPAAHSQAVARTYGRLNDLHGATSVYVEIAKTVDAFLNELHVKKQGLTDVVDGIVDENESTGSIIREVLQWIKENR